MVSVCIATYNGEKYIKDQLLSILCQIDNYDEIIVSDDSSTDETLNIIRSINDNRIRILDNNKYQSPIYNFENAIKHANGDYIFLSDQDDVWLPDRIKLMKTYLDNYCLVISDCKIVDSLLNVTNESFFKLCNSGKGFWKNLIKNSYIGCCMAFKKDLLKYVLPFPKNLPMHDIWIGLLAELNGDVLFIDTPLLLYRRHGTNASSSGEESKYSLYYKVEYRLLLLLDILKRQYFRI